MTNSKVNCTCIHCNHYPFFHYVPSINGEDIEYTKHDNNYSTVKNHTTKEKYKYMGKTWGKVKWQ